MYLNLMVQVLSNHGVVRLVNFEKSKLAKNFPSWQSTFIMSSFLHVFRLSPYKIQIVKASPTIIICAKCYSSLANEWINCFPKSQVGNPELFSVRRKLPCFLNTHLRTDEAVNTVCYSYIRITGTVTPTLIVTTTTS